LTDANSLQLSHAIRLRREAWAGVAIDRTNGDLLDLEMAGFAVPVPFIQSMGLHFLSKGQ